MQDSRILILAYLIAKIKTNNNSNKHFSNYLSDIPSLLLPDAMQYYFDGNYDQSYLITHFIENKKSNKASGISFPTKKVYKYLTHDICTLIKKDVAGISCYNDDLKCSISKCLEFNSNLEPDILHKIIIHLNVENFISDLYSRVYLHNDKYIILLDEEEIEYLMYKTLIKKFNETKEDVIHDGWFDMWVYPEIRDTYCDEMADYMINKINKYNHMKEIGYLNCYDLDTVANSLIKLICCLVD